MNVFSENISLAIHNAAKGHRSKEQVRKMLENEEAYIKDIMESIKNETYINRIAYNEFELITKVGKHRHIEQPSLFTRVLQHIFIVLIEPLYDKLDPKLSFNCKKGYGVTASDKSRSVLHRIKHIMYERKDLHYALQIDQRKCYEHMYRKTFRKAMKLLTNDKELIDFSTNIVFHSKTLPVGTPTSPLAHHIIMLKFDRWLGSIDGPKIRYADDCILFFRTKEEANEAKWRIRNFWWYELRILAKRNTIRLLNIDTEAVSFCGLVCRRSVSDHEKGYTVTRKNVRKYAHECKRNESWASYYGMMKRTDSFRTMKEIEKDMNFNELTEKIKIERDFDAEPISIAELAKQKFNIYDYEIRSIKDKDGNTIPNWVRLLIGIQEKDSNGNPTGKYLRYCFKTEATGIVQFMVKVKEMEDNDEKALPIIGCELENAAGFIFKGSTNREKYCSNSNMHLNKHE